MTITKQRVEEIISRIEMYGHGAGYTVDEVYDLAVLALNLSNIANLKRYELDMDGCDSFGQDCGADMTEDPDGDYVLFDDVVKLFEFDTTTKKLETPATDAFLAEVLAQVVKSPSNAVQSVIAERQRHQSAEGWTPEHDDQYSKSQLLWASSCYVLNAIHPFNRIPFDWPWTPEWWKPTNPRRDLVKAGALILAEIERIDRQEAAQ
ncbi:hypothetical protein HZ25_003370 [Escherichia coli]|uniref:hypothetical protein n=1 Tax=Enterobacteria phage Sf101 TaxID=1524881 RepID=UPI0004F83CA4|nr:hypothetical protein ACQ51_gp22 [Enterobacteria phage Sf101]AII27846.1 hypothetical protein Sf101_0022 [Enterobacteria phage Sf101]EFH4100398.1 hypothetical protein [Escherichia coli]EFL9551421.1 hypothetical protein [Escherichia coli]